MKAKQETINKLRDLILASEGRTLEGDFSAFYLSNGGLKKHYYDIPEGRVLRALGPDYFIDGNGTMGYVFDNSEARIIARWTLCLPAHEQEEETLQALIDILTQRK